MKRCLWAGNDPLMIKYHDEEWGVPVHDDRKLFEFMVLDAMQAGLSWRITLHKREGMRQAFANFNPIQVAKYDEDDITRLLQDPGIIRNRQKIAATITNARHFLEIQVEHGSFDKYLWSFMDGQPLVNNFVTEAEIPTKTELSDRISAELQKKGFKFVGSTITYAFMQSAGLVNDHTGSCFRHQQLA